MLLTVMLAFGGVLQPGADSIFESELWPGEGRPVFVAVARELVLHEPDAVCQSDQKAGGSS